MKVTKSVRILLGVISAFIAIGALPVGLLMILHPDGSSMGMDTELLRNAPFGSFLIPGLYLLVINGLGNLLTAILAFSGKKSAARAGIVFGLLLLIWIIAQVYWIGMIHFLQPAVFVCGLLIMMLSSWLFSRKKG